MSSLETEVAELIQIERDLWVSNLSTFASFAFLVYDTIITMDQEVEYVWKSKWSVPKVLYFLNRWIGLAQALFGAIGVASWSLSDFFCAHTDIPIRSAFQILASFIVDLLLVLRLRALYGDRRRMKLLLLLVPFFYLGCEITGTILVGINFPQGKPPQLSAAAGCLPEGTGPYFYLGVSLAYGSSCVFAGFLFLLTILRLYPVLGKREINTPLLLVFMRDGSAYFGLIFTVYALTWTFIIKLDTTPREGLGGATMGWCLAIQTTACSRLFLNLRGAVAQPSYATTYDAPEKDQNRNREENAA